MLVLPLPPLHLHPLPVPLQPLRVPLLRVLLLRVLLPRVLPRALPPWSCWVPPPSQLPLAMPMTMQARVRVPPPRAQPVRVPALAQVVRRLPFWLYSFVGYATARLHNWDQCVIEVSTIGISDRGQWLYLQQVEWRLAKIKNAPAK